MPNVPIVTSVTKAELDALVAASGLNEGLQYKVTDTNIDWLLIATSSNTLKSINGVIKLMNGILFPSYIDSEIIYLDTGLTYDVDENDNIFITGPSGYLFESALVKSSSNLSAFSIMNSDAGSETATITVSANDLVGIRKLEDANRLLYGFQLYAITAVGVESPGLRCVIKLVKSYYDI